MNDREDFKQLRAEMLRDWRQRAQTVAGFGEEASALLRQVWMEETPRRRLTETKRRTSESMVFFYRAVQALHEERSAVSATLPPALPGFPGIHFWDNSDALSQFAEVLERLYTILEVKAKPELPP